MANDFRKVTIGGEDRYIAKGVPQKFDRDEMEQAVEIAGAIESVGGFCRASEAARIGRILAGQNHLRPQN